MFLTFDLVCPISGQPVGANSAAFFPRGAAFFQKVAALFRHGAALSPSKKPLFPGCCAKLCEREKRLDFFMYSLSSCIPVFLLYKTVAEDL